MDHIDQFLATTAVDSENFNAAIRASIGLAKRTLNKYYSLTDFSDVYRIAMGPISIMFSLCAADEP